MPYKNGTNTPQEKAFIVAMAATGDPVESARRAGYAHPGARAHDLMNRPKIGAEVAKMQMERITGELLPLAVDALKRLLINPKTPAGAVVQAAKVVMDRSFGEDGKDGKAPHEMTGDELARALDRLRHEAVDRARPVIEGTTSAQPAPNVMD